MFALEGSPAPILVFTQPLKDSLFPSIKWAHSRCCSGPARPSLPCLRGHQETVSEMWKPFLFQTVSPATECACAQACWWFWATNIQGLTLSQWRVDLLAKSCSHLSLPWASSQMCPTLLLQGLSRTKAWGLLHKSLISDKVSLDPYVCLQEYPPDHNRPSLWVRFCGDTAQRRV